MDVSIILVNYNTKEITSECINSIFTHTKNIDFEVILVDNDSKDGSQEHFIHDNRIKFIESGSNLGFGKANNLGVLNSSGKYVFFLNSDTLLVNNAVKMLFDFCESNQEIKLGALGCLLMDSNRERTHSYGVLPSVNSLLSAEVLNHFTRRFGKEYTGFDCLDETENNFKVGYVTGADLFIPRKVFSEIGGAFDPDFFMYCEETEMQWRMNKKGYDRLITKGPKIIHLEQKSSASVTNIRKLIRSERSLFLYLKKTSSSYAYYFFRVSYFILRLYFIVKPSLTKDEKKDYIKHLIQGV